MGKMPLLRQWSDCEKTGDYAIPTDLKPCQAAALQARQRHGALPVSGLRRHTELPVRLINATRGIEDPRQFEVHTRRRPQCQ